MYAPYGTWNRIIVYLSSPKHGFSGDPGRECRNPGWEENVMGRYWNYHAANSAYYGERKDPGSEWRNLRARGYWVRVSENSRGGRVSTHVSSANEWKRAFRSELEEAYVVTHTNAAKSCTQTNGGGPDYSLVMYSQGNEKGKTFSDVLASKLPVRPHRPSRTGCKPEDNCRTGTDVQYFGDRLYELNGKTSDHPEWNHYTFRAYVETHFHSNQSAQTWFCCAGGFAGSAQWYTWRYGWALDRLLGYPGR
ncbi:MAG: hypothetical protein ACREA0_00495 [bacterium]